jgi:hypothetical protein
MHRELLRLMKEAGKQAANDPEREADKSPAKVVAAAPAGRSGP